MVTKLKKAVICLLAILLATILVVGCGQTQGKAAAGYSTFKKAGIKMTYPSDWVVKEGFMGTIAAFFSPPNPQTKKSAANVNIISVELPTDKPISLDDFNKATVQELAKLTTDFSMIDLSPITMADSPAYRIIYTGRMGNYNLKFMQAWTLKDQKLSMVTYTASVDEYDLFAEEAHKMIGSFKI